MNFYLPYALPVEFGRSASKGIGIKKREPPKLGSTGAPPLWDGGVADP